MDLWRLGNTNLALQDLGSQGSRLGLDLTPVMRWCKASGVSTQWQRGTAATHTGISAWLQNRSECSKQWGQSTTGLSWQRGKWLHPVSGRNCHLCLTQSPRCCSFPAVKGMLALQRILQCHTWLQFGTAQGGRCYWGTARNCLSPAGSKSGIYILNIIK